MFVFALMTFTVQLLNFTCLAPCVAGVLTRLKYPYPRDVEEPNMYETVRIHAEIGRTFSVQQSPNFSVSVELCSANKFNTFGYARKSLPLVCKLIFPIFWAKS